MSKSELWQVFDSSGKAITAKGLPPEAFTKDPALYMANAHVWIWRENNKHRELLLQRRALDLVRRPGFLHASASGHVNVNESATDAAIREANEELGISLEPTNLTHFFTISGGLNNESFNYVFGYQYQNASLPNINEHEVMEAFWITLDSFAQMAKEPDKHKLIDLGSDYFSMLISSLSKL
jgi:isopentenyl-diphosphate delta-isomerase